MYERKYKRKERGTYRGIERVGQKENEAQIR